MAFKPFDLTGKVALVTGGNGGIGLGMADGMAQCGSDIVIWGTNLEKNAKAEAQLKAHGVRVLTQQIDVSNEQQVIDGMAEALAFMGRLDTVIANAGIGAVSPFEDYPTEMYRRVVGVNLDGVFFTLRAACKHMVERSRKGDTGGSLIVTSSLSAVHGAARNEIYAATKGGVVTMVRGLAVEYGRYGIRANTIMPGWTATDMTHDVQHDEKFVANVISRVPVRRWGTPEDFSGIAIYLASDASSFHTGDSMLIDGAYAIY